MLNFLANEKFSLKHEEIGRPLYFDAQATTPVVSSSNCEKHLIYIFKFESNNFNTHFLGS